MFLKRLFGFSKARQAVTVASRHSQDSSRTIRDSFEHLRAKRPITSYIAANADSTGDNDLLVFFHAQRTAGSVFRHVLAEVYGKERVYAPQFKPSYQHWNEAPVEELSRCLAYAGHSNYTPKETGRRNLYISLLRNPVYRAASLHTYCQHKEGHALRELALATEMEEFYERGSELKPGYFRDTQCRRICGKPDASRAIELIESQYLAIGASENLAGFVADLGGVLGWPALDIEEQPADHERYADRVSDRFIDLVLDTNRQDMKLWAHMMEHYFLREQ